MVSLVQSWPLLKKLCKGHAAEIFGKLSFSEGHFFGRFGRMYLAPFKLRQYGKNGCSHITAEIERAIAFWLYVLPRILAHRLSSR